MQEEEAKKKIIPRIILCQKKKKGKATTEVPTMESILHNSPGRVTRRYAVGKRGFFSSHHTILLISNFFVYSRLAMLQRGEGTSTQPTMAASPTKQKTSDNKSPARKLTPMRLKIN